VDVDYNMETNWDYVTIAGVPLTGQGRYTTHYCGALPVKLTTDGSVASAGVTLTARNLVDGYQCTINPVAGTTNCSGNVTAQAASGMATAAIDLTNFREAYISAQICNPTGWVLNIGDSPSNNGGSGDGGEFSNDAELEIQGTQLNVLGRDGSNPVVQFQDASFVGSTDCTWRSFKIADRTIEVGEKNIRLASDNLIRINQPDTEGQPNALIYMGLNRVIGGTFRSGSGVQQATVLLRR
jgi:hypothetical protein